jgi:SulP family sulfate permease
MLALLVGIFQLVLGVFKLGVVVNFLSHPVIVGFTNAAAIIIGLSQVNKLIGVPMGRSESFVNDIWGVLQLVGDTHLPTLAMGVVAIAIMWVIRSKAPQLPGVLIAVVLTTLVSWQIGFERTASATMDQIADAEAQALLTDFVRTEARIGELTAALVTTRGDLKKLQNRSGETAHAAATLNYEIELLRLQRKDREDENRKRNRALRSFVFEQVPGAAGEPAKFFAAGKLLSGAQSDGRHWHIARIGDGSLQLTGGGEVVGRIPEGLPSVGLPKFSWDMIGSLLSAAIIISLVGFMEAISIAKAIAAKTRDKIDPNQELIGQGLANLVGAMTQAFPVSGSFSRSAVNINAGARAGMSSVITAAFVLLTLLFLTPLLYHLPQAVLAACDHHGGDRAHKLRCRQTCLAGQPARRHRRRGYLRRHPGGGAPSRQGHPARRRPGHRPVSVPHHDAARGHPRPLSRRYAARRQGQPPARVAGGGCRALRRPPLLCQCVVLRGHDPRGRGRQPADRLSADRQRRHQRARRIGRGGWCVIWSNACVPAASL